MIKKISIYYYNIDYFCNNNCVFCFSHFKNDFSRTMKMDSIIDNLETWKPAEEDIIVINGGEPTIHPDFYDILEQMQKFSSRIVVYSNGVKIDVDRIKNNNAEFIIPIHGTERVHDAITNVSGSYMNTLSSLKGLQDANIKYSIKFILSRDIINTHYSISKQLKEYELVPDRIYLARLNETPKCRSNFYLPPDEASLVEYLVTQLSELQWKYLICFLDFTPCILEKCMLSINNLKSENYTDYSVPNFYYNDHTHDMHKENYRKERLVFEKCDRCGYKDLCNLMCDSYFLIASENNKCSLILE